MSAIRDEMIEIKHWLDEKKRRREQALENRVRCVICGEKVGQCKMVKPASQMVSGRCGMNWTSER